MALAGVTVQSALGAAGALGNQLLSVDGLAAGAADALRQAPNLTPAGAAGFLATCAMESAYFRTTTEYGSGQRYAPYIGRTFIQLTWQANYQAFGNWCKARGLVTDANTFVNNPASLSDPRWAWLGAIFYFEVNNIWRWANAGNFLAVSQAVNGGVGRVGTAFVPNGWRERQAMYGVFLAVGPALMPSASAGPTTQTLIGDDMALKDWDVRGTGEMRKVMPVGAASSIVAQAWISLVAWGPKGASVHVFAQTDTGGKDDRTLVAEVSDGHSTRPWWELPSGTTQLTLQYTAPDGANISIEAKPK